MSLSTEELEQHCQAIVTLSKINHRIVILCEGDINSIKGRVHLYRRLDIFPDANFYKACIPEWWQEKKPIFVPCGDKIAVLNTYFRLNELNFNQGKLFAIIDLDLQPPCILKNYPIENTEQLFNILYQKNIPQLDTIKQNQIFITGLIYKEAYFLIPELQDLFDKYLPEISFDNETINLEEIYRKMALALNSDSNLATNFNIACNRINYLQQLDLTNINALQQSWLNTFNAANETEKTTLIYALLAIHRVKEYWKAIKPKHSDIAENRFKEQLTLAIGNFYAQLPQSSSHHLPSFFNALSAHS